MEGAAVLSVGHFAFGIRKLLKRDIAQGSRSGNDRVHNFSCGFTVGAPHVVFGVNQIMFFHRVDDYDAVSFGKRRGTQYLDGTEVREDHAVAFAEYRAELVEQTAFESEVVVFHALTAACPFRLVEVDSELFADGVSGGGFKCRAAGHSCRQRNAALDGGIESGDFISAFGELFYHSFDITASVARHIIEVGKIELHRGSAAEISQSADCSLGALHGKSGILCHGAGENKTLIVVGVVSQDLKPSGSHCRRSRRAAVKGGEFVDKTFHNDCFLYIT